MTHLHALKRKYEGLMKQDEINAIRAVVEAILQRKSDHDFINKAIKDRCGDEWSSNQYALDWVIIKPLLEMIGVFICNDIVQWFFYEKPKDGGYINILNMENEKTRQYCIKTVDDLMEFIEKECAIK